MPQGSIKYLNRGLTQDERLIPALLPQHLKIDDRNALQLLSFLDNYAKLLNYYDCNAETGQLQRDGDWRFFTNDSVFRLAEIAHTSSNQYNEDFNLIASAFANKNTEVSELIYALRLLFNNITEILTQINAWISYLDNLHDDFKEVFITILQKKISPLLVSVLAYSNFFQNHVNITEYIYFNKNILKTFDPKYWLYENSSQEIELQVKAMIADVLEISNDAEILLANYNKIAQTAQYILNYHNQIIKHAYQAFTDLLQSTKSNKKPDLGLLLAFLKLFEKAQEKINNLTAKHLKFYYHEVLKFSIAPLVCDSTYLVFNLDADNSAFLLEAGTLFDAGKDVNGNTIVYQATQNSVLNQTQIVGAYTLLAACNPIVQAPSNQAHAAPLITGIYQANPTIPIVSNGFPLFGEDQFMLSDHLKTMQETDLGFVISSPTFLLSAGNRTITIDINFTEPTFESNFINRLQQFVFENQKDKNSCEALFQKIFKQAFAVSTTGLKNWFPLQIIEIKYKPMPHCSISLVLNLDASAPAITAYNPKIHGAQYDTPYPLIRFIVKHNYPYYAYNFLNQLALTSISVTTDVKDFRTLSLSNQHGAIDASKPFQPLGVQPEVGDYLLIGSPEVFNKYTKSVEVLLDWQALPSTGDFSSYYKSYAIDPPYTNDSFLVSAAFLSNKQWISPQKFTPVFKLYETVVNPEGTASQSIRASSLFKLDPITTEMESAENDSDSLNQPIIYNQFTRNGFMKLELSAPVLGFAASLYSSVLSNSVMENAKVQLDASSGIAAKFGADIGISGNTIQALPQPPFTPIAKGISINFMAHTSINLLPGAHANTYYQPFYHLNAFSVYPVKSSETENSKVPSDNQQIGAYKMLMPHYSHQGNLYIALNNLNAPESVSILFQLSEKALETTVLSLPVLVWSYLSNNEWKNFVPGANIHDATSGLIKTGIVVLDIPADITMQNSIMPSSMYWIRIQVQNDLEVFSNLLGIYTQAITVQYSNPQITQRNETVLPAMSIKKAVLTIAGVKTISQPLPSFGGLAAEDEKAYYTRVSERLRHKKRAINSWDFEHIALQQFPQIYQTKCIVSSNLTISETSNCIVELVVVPRIEASVLDASLDVSGPVFGFTMLEEIKMYLQRYTSVHAQVMVRNPVYEKLIVKCKVKFSAQNPFYIKQLNEDIYNFLAPWINQNSIKYSIGKVYRNPLFYHLFKI